MFVRDGLEVDRELHVRAADDVLDFEPVELRREAELLDDACVFARGHAALFFVLRAGADHLAWVRRAYRRRR